MEDINLVPGPKYFTIGKKKYDVARISAERTLKAQAMYNKKIKGVYYPDHESANKDGYIKYESDYELILSLLDCVFMLIRIDFKLSRAWEWLRRIVVTKRHILKVVEGKEIMDFVEDALEPIIGDKKKELRRQEKAEEAMMILMDKISPEALAELLRNSLATLDTQKITS
jgi:hypothetical protein